MEEQWKKEYIDGIDITKIEWITLNTDELKKFFDENYLDKENWRYIKDKEASNVYPVPFGMHYLNMSPMSDKYRYLLGVANNGIGKKTIIADVMFDENYIIFHDQEVPVTYISYVEVNSFFRNQGLYKTLCEQLAKVIKFTQPLIYTRESEMGQMCHTARTLREVLLENGFSKSIWEDDSSNIYNPEFYEQICGKPRGLKK